MIWTVILSLFFGVDVWANHPVLDKPIAAISELASVEERLYKTSVAWHGRPAAGESLKIRHLLALPRGESTSMKRADDYLRTNFGLGILQMTANEVANLETIDFSHAPRFKIEDLHKIPLIAGTFDLFIKPGTHSFLNATGARYLGDLDNWTLDELIEYMPRGSRLFYRIISQLKDVGYNFRRSRSRSTSEQTPRIHSVAPPDRRRLALASPRLAQAIYGNESLSSDSFLWDLWDWSCRGNFDTPSGGRSYLWLIDHLNRRFQVFTLNDLLLLPSRIDEGEWRALDVRFKNRTRMSLLEFLAAIDQSVNKTTNCQFRAKL